MKTSTLGNLKTVRATRATARERASWVNRWERSGQSQVDFARDHGLRVGTLRRWVRNGTVAGRDVADSVALQEVDLAAMLARDLPGAAREWEAEIRLPNGVTLAISGHAAAGRVRDLVEAVRC